MSVMHETKQDKEHEHLILDTVSKKWKSSIQYTPVAYHVDGVLLNGTTVRAFAEVRIAHCERKKYPNYILSLQKYKYIVEIFNVVYVVRVQFFIDNINPRFKGIGFFKNGTKTLF